MKKSIFASLILLAVFAFSTTGAQAHPHSGGGYHGGGYHGGYYGGYHHYYNSGYYNNGYYNYYGYPGYAYPVYPSVGGFVIQIGN